MVLEGGGVSQGISLDPHRASDGGEEADLLSVDSYRSSRLVQWTTDGKESVKSKNLIICNIVPINRLMGLMWVSS